MKQQRRSINGVSRNPVMAGTKKFSNRENKGRMVASFTIQDADKFTPQGARRIARWMEQVAGYIRDKSIRKKLDKTFRARYFAAPLIAFLLLASQSFATTYYIATTGNDSNNGTSSGTPFLTFSHAISTASASDTINVAAGTYQAPSAIDVTKALTIVGAANHTSIINCTAAGAHNGFIIDADTITIDGFKIVNGDQGVGAGYPGAAHANVTVQNNWIDGAQNGVWIVGTGWLVYNNEITRSRLYSGNDCNYMILLGNNNTIRGNYCHGTNIGDGSTSDICPPSQGGRYANGPCSHLDGIQFFGLGTYTCKNNLVELNYFTDFSNSALFISDEANSTDISNLIVRNNTIIGVTFQSADTGTTDNSAWGVCIGKNYGATNVSVTNNYEQNVSLGLGLRSGSGNVSGNMGKNIFYNVGAIYNNDANNPSASIINAGNMNYNCNWANGNYSQDVHMNPLQFNLLKLLGNDGLPMTSDDGWIPTAAGATTYGPQIGGSPPTPVSITNNSATVTENSTANVIDVLANDTPQTAVTVASVTQPSHGTTAIGTGAVLTQTVKPLDGEQVVLGAKTYTYKTTLTPAANEVLIGATLATAITNLIHAVNASGGTPGTDYGAVTANVSAVASQGAAGKMVIIQKSGITGASVSLTETLSNGSWSTATMIGAYSVTYTPTTGYSGSDSFQYVAQTASNQVGTGVVTVTVSAIAHAPIANNDAYTISMNAPAKLLSVLANDSSPDNLTLSIKSASVSSPSAGGTASISGTSILYQPAANYVGTETFTYQAYDGTNATTATVTITVASPPTGTPLTTGTYPGEVTVRDAITGQLRVAPARPYP